MRIFLTAMALGGLGPALAPAAGLLPGGPESIEIDTPENRATRVTTLAPVAARWSRSGKDAARFSIERGVLRFRDSVACEAGGICAADGTRLLKTPGAAVIPPG